MIVAQTTGASVWVVSGHLNQPWLEMHEDIVMHTLSGLPGSKLIPYSGKFSLVQIFAEKRPDCSEEIFAVFIFADGGRSGHTSTS